MFFDAHNHLQFEEFTPHLDQIVADLTAINLGGAVVNGTHPLNDWNAVTTLAQRHPWIVPSYGIHPWDVRIRPVNWQSIFHQTLCAQPHAAVGEIGLDTFILKPARQAPPLSTPFAPPPSKSRSRFAPGNSDGRPIMIAPPQFIVSKHGLISTRFCETPPSLAPDSCFMPTAGRRSRFRVLSKKAHIFPSTPPISIHAGLASAAPSGPFR